MATLHLNISSERLEKRIAELAKIGQIEETGVCRLALSKEDKQAVETVKQWMIEAGMNARIDHFGNLIGRFEGKNRNAPVLMIGSHIDSQPYGGRFDGTIGVLGGIEVVQTMKENGIVPDMAIEVAAFCDEEGCRFNKGLFGVRGILGKLEPEELGRKDKNGVTRKQALIDFGCDPSRFHESEYEAGTIGAYLELHIEQGPILEAMNRPVGIVTGISGPLWLTVEMVGFAGHAGSVPMSMRQDGLLGAAKVIVKLNEIASRYPENPTVGTVGSLRVFPDSRNIIPERVVFTIDLRDIDIERRHKYEAELRQAIEEIAGEHGLAYTIREDTNSEPRYCAASVMEKMREACMETGVDAPELMSGPFHDALAMSYVCDYGMIFVRCKDGISHNPKEFSTYEDIALGTEVLYKTVLKMSSSFI
ncbi:M20 family metallo-hydrolase [Aneurinibacillus aneurinilyticus]|uniref:Putative N-carbamoyl-L-amino-acid hydrolase n=1 Tax=Aneurinibacillus aneurinilyticus ATCC 12856 TaxID=649747 RepID=U1Y7Y2_ANEAE|nr:M20 family metallo-hydrolase [Aneurinibacillus aneurinilyticus]ERI06951.1 putative N-carbamoyl-L-amino-acid hydrolase [Aneurinibacillus aneurinilyticus ATCC 12856]MED0669169.1 M20 family metallo-hydrolase [Aneurinibacillus aneurinilyticus]MED0707885.1 M20 family metallo-hydrolase [Aneurinibacillus aneurinilyticus]MED0722298.1 M20 family metallo-hydrolase [Aneurinibacillus aneurinilyticus]MED0734205.1 M20 family metallo-hydrolase [Aneurinibacillus aneurinilyticus]